MRKAVQYRNTLTAYAYSTILGSTLGNLLVKGHEMSKIAVANQKGGVGKTATVVNLGAALAQREYNVLLIDCDPQANVTESVGIEAEGGIGIYELLMEPEVGVGEVIVATEWEGLGVVASDLKLAGAEVELAGARRRNTRLRDKLEEWDGGRGKKAGTSSTAQGADSTSGRGDGYDYVLIDTPPSLGFLTINALSAADEVLIPVQASYLAMHGLQRLLGTVEAVQEHNNPALELGGLLLTMFDRRTVHAREVEERLREHFGDKVYETVIHRSIDFDYATVARRPLVFDGPGSRGASAYRRLAQEVIEHA